MPISKAVQASAALPGLFPPVAIDGRHCVDGALKKTLHASVLLDEGLDLLICLNPRVSFDASASMRHRVLAGAEARIPRLVDGGLPVVLSQTFRTLIHSRLKLGMKGYELSHPDTTILLFEPDQRDPQMFLANTFSYAQRRALAEHADQRTRQTLRSRRGAARSAANWRATACSSTMRCSTTPGANCCPAPSPPGAAWVVSCGGSKKCSTIWKTRWPRGRRRPKLIAHRSRHAGQRQQPSPQRNGVGGVAQSKKTACRKRFYLLCLNSALTPQTPSLRGE